MPRNSVTEPLTASIDIDAPPDTVYHLVADIPSMGRRSPECRRCVWISGDDSVPGAQFRGTNRQFLLRWSTICEIEVADGYELTFKVIKGAAGRRTRWRFRFEPLDGATHVTQDCEPITFKRSSPLSAFLNLLRGGGDRVDQVHRGMHTTLANLKQDAESTPATSSLSKRRG
jgi:Polyketide cyclase / dehydrase and lipid transport